MEESFSVGPNGKAGQRLPVFFARVFIPFKNDRATFIKKCKSTCTLTLIAQDGNEVIRRVNVDTNVMQNIQFPYTVGRFEGGSLVCCVNVPIYNIPMVIGVLNEGNDVGITLGENDQRLFKENKTNGTFAELILRGDTGEIDINVDSATATDVESNINILNKNNKATLKAYVQGDIKLIADNDLDITVADQFNIKIADYSVDKNETFINYTKGVGLNYTDEFGNQIQVSKEQIQLAPEASQDGFLIGTGKEYMILGNTFKSIFGQFTDLFDKLLTNYSTTKVNTAFGPSTPPLPPEATNVLQIQTDLATLKQKYDTFLSKLSKTD